MSNFEVKIGNGSNTDTVLVGGKRKGTVAYEPASGQYIARNEVGWNLGSYDRATAIDLVAGFNYAEWDVDQYTGKATRKMEGIAPCS